MLGTDGPVSSPTAWFDETPFADSRTGFRGNVKEASLQFSHGVNVYCQWISWLIDHSFSIALSNPGPEELEAGGDLQRRHRM